MSTHETAHPEEKKTAATIVDSLFDVGEAWASYGLKVGQLALETSARTLGGVARTLGALAEGLKKPEEDVHVIDGAGESVQG